MVARKWRDMQNEDTTAGGNRADLERILDEARRQGIDLSRSTDEMVAKFAYCVSERILAGEPMKKAIARCLVEIRDFL